MTNRAKCEDTISASQTLTCSSSRSSTDSECHGIDVDTDACTANDHNCSSHCSTSDESADTRKSLIDLRMVNDSNENVKTAKISIYRTAIKFVIGCLLVAAGVRTIVVPIYDYTVARRLEMSPTLPSYHMWVKPSPEVRLNLYIFTAENAEAFLNGTDDKLRLKEIGPIVYREHLEHTDVVFHPNSTMSYTAVRNLEFLEDENEPGILNRTIYVANFVVLATAASLNDASFVKKIGFNYILSKSTDSLFMNITVYQYLWEYKSDLVQTVKQWAPFLVPTENSGALYQIYNDFTDRYNILIGPNYDGNKFFEITSVNGDTVVPGFKLAYGDCNASIVGSSEGAQYKTNLNESSVMWYWRKALCRQVPLYFEKTVPKGPFTGYKYVLRENAYDRFNDSATDCYKGPAEPLPDGLSDLSKCYFDMPFAASNPHFYGRYPNRLTEKLDGFNPIKEKHQSFIIAEPTLGVPIDQSARSQNNVIIPNLYGFSDRIRRFSNMALPTFWLSYHQRELTTGITCLMVFTIYVLPILQYFIMAALFVSGAMLIRASIREFGGCSKEKSHTTGSLYDQNCRLNVEPLEVMLQKDLKTNLERNTPDN